MNDPALVKEVQLKLYALNYDPGRVDGVMAQGTRNAIREWQKVAGLPETGTLDAEHLQRLRDSRPSSTWAAIAYTARGANGWAFGKPSRAEAEQSAIDNCLRQAGRGAECKLITGSGSACVTLATYRTQRGGTVYFGAHAALRPTLADAISQSLRACNDAENSRGNCAAKVSICADGSHRK